ncbi:MAG: SDR family oxidoreductase [Bacteroidota bacterium]
MANHQQKNYLVTGASTGIGYGIAAYLLKQGGRVLGSVRKEADAQRVREQLGAQFHPLIFDVCDEPAIGRAAEEVQELLAGQGLAGLVNNAGIAVSGPMMHLPISEVQRQLDINVLGVLRVTKAFLPLLGAQKPAAFPPGRIVNISSVSGRIAAPFVGPYAISKHGLEALTHSLRRELLIYGIDAISIQPGAVKTPIWGKAVEEIHTFPGTDYEPLLKEAQATIAATEKRAIEVERVAKVVWRALSARRPKTRYLIDANPLWYWLLFNIIPDRVMDGFMRRAFNKALRNRG